MVNSISLISVFENINSRILTLTPILTPTLTPTLTLPFIHAFVVRTCISIDLVYNFVLVLFNLFDFLNLYVAGWSSGSLSGS